jgi:carboxyl-terminal processing protease
MRKAFFIKSCLFFKSSLSFGFILGLILINGCQKKDEIVIDNGIPAEIRSVNNFILDNMKIYYLWNNKMPAGLNPDTEKDPKAFFDKLLYKTDDKWSFITDDYEKLINSFQGVNLSFGHEFRLYKESNSNNIFGIVAYVIAGSPADSAGIKRGDIFNKINNTLLTTDNYQALLFDLNSYNIGFAEFVNSELVSNGITKTLNAVEITENPIFLTKVFNINGTKIGYLVYMKFISNFEDELKKAFQDFKSEGINSLIIDLRYNPGGSVTTSRFMGSLIAPSDVVGQGKIFAKYIWNSNMNDYLVKNDGADSETLVVKFLPDLAGNSLNLDHVYFITTDFTASASELLINALKPYSTVVTLGSATFGKYTASITMHDPVKSHNWAIQPIVIKLANANNVTDYKNGFSPDYPVNDDFSAELGSLDEDMLAQAVSVITGIPVNQLARVDKSSRAINQADRIMASDLPAYQKELMFIDFPALH